MHWDVPEECKNPHRGQKVIHEYLKDGFYVVDWRKAKKMHKKLQCYIIDEQWLT